MPLALRSLEAFVEALKIEFVPADLPGLKPLARQPDKVKDCYLADLAERNAIKPTTLDPGIAPAPAGLIK